jgi:uncharacterized alpha-E superfamily protein
MLSRVAESMYWLSRNIERAETLARILDVNLSRTMDRYSASSGRAMRVWRGVVGIVGMTTDLANVTETQIAQTAFEYCTFSTESRTSILSCIRIARQNALGVRAELSTEVWEAINGLYLFVEAQSPRSIAREGPSSFLRSVRNTTQAIGGVIDATITHDEAWDFLQLGRFLERATITSRIVQGHDPSDESAEELQRILEMCCASEPFAKARHLSMEPTEVLDFILLNQTFPRSVRFCVEAMDAALHQISETQPGTFSNDAERIVGRLLPILEFVQVDEIAAEGSPNFAARIVDRLSALSSATESTYFPRVPVA